MKKLIFFLLIALLFVVACGNKPIAYRVEDVSQPTTEEYGESPSFVSSALMSEIEYTDKRFAAMRERAAIGGTTNTSAECYTYTIVEDDTLADLCWALYGKGPTIAQTLRIKSLNEDIVDVNVLSIGQRILIPLLGE